MPQFNLTTLSGAELRNLLDSARARGEARMSYQILQEMASRRDVEGGRRGWFRGKRPAEPRVIDMELGDPLEGQDDIPPAPHWRAPERIAPEPKAAAKPRRRATPEPAPAPEPPQPSAPEPEPALVIELTPAATRRPRRTAARRKPAPPPRTPEPVELAEPLPSLELRPRSVWDDEPPPPKAKAAPAPRPERRPKRIGLAAAFVVGAAAGVMAGWGLSQVEGSGLSAPAAKPVQTAALTTAPPRATQAVLPVVAEPAPAPEAPADTPLEATVPEATEEAAPPAETGEVHDATGEALELPSATTEPAARKVEAVAPRDLCAAEPTPADREICADPELRRLQRALRQAYADALDAHEDRALLRERQLAWADARDGISDRQQLVRLYEQRIRKLNAATAEARRVR